MNPVIFWFRKDLRLKDHPALNLALDSGSPVYCIATADQVGTLFSSLSRARQDSLTSSWFHLDRSLDGKLVVLDSPKELVRFAKQHDIKSVYVSNVYDPGGVSELNAVEKDLSDIGANLFRGPGNYAVPPGTVRKGDGTAYRVYTPFFNEWAKHANPEPVAPGDLTCVASRPTDFQGFDSKLELEATVIAGEDEALKTLQRFLGSRVADYADQRNRADLGGTSHLSHALSHGEINPRTILAALPQGDGAEVFRKEIAWREFYADVMHHRPETLNQYLEPKFIGMRYDEPGDKFELWKAGQTGFPMVDAGMRQLLTTGWMHNRVRMIVASFLVKDLHLEWQLGATWFEEHLTDFDPASNSHGWQWTAGCGTDASPYYRVFNPISQGFKFDPNGDYVRKFIPELRHLDGSSALEPWEHPHGYSFNYAKRIVDHAAERVEALARLEELKQP